MGPGGQTLWEERALAERGSGADKRGRLVRENAGERAWVVRAERLASGPGNSGAHGADQWAWQGVVKGDARVR